jgi:hypothetical protein
MPRKLTPAEAQAYRELARAARKLQEAQQEAEAQRATRRTVKLDRDAAKPAGFARHTRH